MKTLFLTLALVIGMLTANQSVAQATKSINYKMKLRAVPLASNFSPTTDKLLVRGSDKILKEVDKSLVFQTTSVAINPVPTPDLQAVLNAGNTYAGTGSYSEKYMEMNNSYPFSQKFTFSSDQGLIFDAGTRAKIKITHGGLTYIYNGFTTSLVSPTDGDVGSGAVLNLPAVSGTVSAIVQGQPVNPNNFGKLGLMMTDGNYLYICISQGV